MMYVRNDNIKIAIKLAEPVTIDGKLFGPGDRIICDDISVEGDDEPSYVIYGIPRNRYYKDFKEVGKSIRKEE